MRFRERLIRNIQVGLISIWLILIAASCAPVGSASPAPTGVPSQEIPASTITPTEKSMTDEDVLIEYIVKDLASGEPLHRFIGMVNAADPLSPLPITNGSIQKCWLLKEGVREDCVPSDLMVAFGNEKITGWMNSYVVFAILESNADWTNVTVRLDELSGPNSTQGLLYNLSRVAGTWQVDRRKVIWTR
jgi:hypothetical protein